jgi:uncharacterized protein YggE
MGHKGHYMAWLVTGLVTIVFGIVVIVIAMNQPGTGGIATEKGGTFEGLDSFGEGRISAAPDKTEIVLGVDSRAAEPAAAAIDNNTKTAKILEAVRGLGVNEKDIQTVNVSLYPEYDYSEPVATPKVTGYLASNTVRITSHDIAQVGPVIDAAINAGATNVQGVTFGFTDETRRELENEARRIATEDALRRATALAQFSGVRLGDPISIVETSSGGTIPPPIYYAPELGGGGTTADTQIQPGSLEIVLTVNVTYEID